MAKAHDLEIKLISKGYKDAPDFKTFSVYCESTNVETEDGPENVLAVKGLISVDAVAEMKEEEDAKKAEHNLLLMITVLRKFLGNKATNKDWNKEMLAYGNAGWSERSFSRRLNILKARKWVNVLGNGAFARTTEGALYEATKLAPEIEEDKTHTTAAQNHGHQTTATPYKGGGGHASRGSGLDDDAPRHRQQTTAIGSGGSGSTNTTTATTESGDGSGYGAEAAAKRAKELLERLKRKPNVRDILRR